MHGLETVGTLIYVFGLGYLMRALIEAVGLGYGTWSGHDPLWRSFLKGILWPIMWPSSVVYGSFREYRDRRKRDRDFRKYLEEVKRSRPPTNLGL